MNFQILSIIIQVLLLIAMVSCGLILWAITQNQKAIALNQKRQTQHIIQAMKNEN